MKNRKRIKLNTAVYVLFLIVYVAGHVFLLTCHEAWRDEGQAWILAKNATLPQLLADLCSEGHPALWFLFMRPFAKLGMSYEYLGVLSLALTTAALTILFFKAPINIAAKISIALSAVFCYYNPVISRVYALVLLLVLLLAMLWKERYEKPVLYGVLVALLFQSHIIMAGLAGGLLLCMAARCFKKETRTSKQIIGTGIAFAGMTCTFLELYQRSDTTVYHTVNAASLLETFRETSIVTGIWKTAHALWPGFCSVVYVALLGCTAIAVLAVLVLLARHNEYRIVGDALVASVCGIGATVALMIWIYSGQYQMTLCLLISLIFSVWTICTDSRQKSVRAVLSGLTAILCLMTLPTWLSSAEKDIDTEFSGSRKMSEYIRDNLPEHSVIAVSYDHKISAPYAYISSCRKDIYFVNTDTEDEYSYYVWGQSYPQKTAKEIFNTAQRLSGTEKLYYLTSSDRDEQLAEEFERIFTSGESSVRDESYYLYQTKDHS